MRAPRFQPNLNIQPIKNQMPFRILQLGAIGSRLTCYELNLNGRNMICWKSEIWEPKSSGNLRFPAPSAKEIDDLGHWSHARGYGSLWYGSLSVLWAPDQWRAQNRTGRFPAHVLRTQKTDWRCFSSIYFVSTRAVENSDLEAPRVVKDS